MRIANKDASWSKVLGNFIDHQILKHVATSIHTTYRCSLKGNRTTFGG